MLSEISVCYVLVGTLSPCRLVCWCLRVIGKFLQQEKCLTSSLVTFVVLDTGPMEKSYIVFGVSWSMCRPIETNVRNRRCFFLGPLALILIEYPFMFAFMLMLFRNVKWKHSVLKISFTFVVKSHSHPLCMYQTHSFLNSTTVCHLTVINPWL